MTTIIAIRERLVTSCLFGCLDLQQQSLSSTRTATGLRGWFEAWLKMSLGKVKEPFGFSNPKPLLPDRSSMIFVAASWVWSTPLSIMTEPYPPLAWRLHSRLSEALASSGTASHSPSSFKAPSTVTMRQYVQVWIK